MKTIAVRTKIQRPFVDVVAGFNEKLFRHLVKGFPPVHIVRFDGLGERDEAHLRLLHPKGPLWVSVMSDFENDGQRFQFLDRGKKLPWPLKSWEHTHKVEKLDKDHSIISDEIVFTAAPGTEFLCQQVFTADMKKRGPKYQSYYGAV